MEALNEWLNTPITEVGIIGKCVFVFLVSFFVFSTISFFKGK